MVWIIVLFVALLLILLFNVKRAVSMTIKELDEMMQPHEDEEDEDTN